MGAPNVAFCEHCGAETDWVTVAVAARLLSVNERRVRELIEYGRLPGSVKHKPPGGTPAFWRVPLESVAMLLKERLSRNQP
jgi:hypothetical protein